MIEQILDSITDSQENIIINRKNFLIIRKTSSIFTLVEKTLEYKELLEKVVAINQFLDSYQHQPIPKKDIQIIKDESSAFLFNKKSIFKISGKNKLFYLIEENYLNEIDTTIDEKISSTKTSLLALIECVLGWSISSSEFSKLLKKRIESNKKEYTVEII